MVSVTHSLKFFSQCTKNVESISICGPYKYSCGQKLADPDLEYTVTGHSVTYLLDVPRRGVAGLQVCVPLHHAGSPGCVSACYSTSLSHLAVSVFLILATLLDI